METAWLLLTLLPVALGQDCTPPTPSLSAAQYALIQSHHADTTFGRYIYLTGLFPIHRAGEDPYSCRDDIDPWAIQNLEAFLWAVRTYRDRYPDNILRGVQIGALGLDTCSSSFKMLQQVENLRGCVVGYGNPAIHPKSLLTFIGPTTNQEAIALSEYIKDNGPTVVSASATMDDLSNKTRFPLFLRTIGSEGVQMEGIVQIVKQRGWEVIQVLYAGDRQTRAGREALKNAANTAGVCLVQEVEISRDGDMDGVVMRLLDHDMTRGVVVLLQKPLIRQLLAAVRRNNAQGIFTWIGTTKWADDPDVVSGLEDVAEGAVTLSLDTTEHTSDFVDAFYRTTPRADSDNPWFREYWSETFQCYFVGGPGENIYNTLCDPEYSTSQTLRGTRIDPSVGYTVQAVDAALNGIGEARRKVCEISNSLCDDFLVNQEWQAIHTAILEAGNPVQFNNNTGDPISTIFLIQNYKRDNRRLLCPNGDHCYQTVRLEPHSINI